MKKGRFGFFTIIFSMMLVLSACGSANGGNQTGAESSPSSETTASAAPTSSDSTVKTITHAGGTTEITGTPKRIVTLEWTYAEDLLAVGVQPVGNADNESYNQWVNVEPKLSADVQDVGTRSEPNLEAIMALKPDLIIGVNFRHEQIYDQLSAIAPTILFNPFPEEDTGVNQYDEMEQTFMTIADIVGKKDEGQKVLDELHGTYEEVAKKLEDAGKAGSEFALVQGFGGDTPTIRLFTTNSMASGVVEQLGLKNAYTTNANFEVYGYSEGTVELLTNVSDANFFYAAQDDDNIFENQLKDNAVWKGLTFNQEGRAYPIGGSTWLFGGPLSNELVAEKIGELLAP